MGNRSNRGGNSKAAAVKVGDEEMREAPPFWEADSEEMSDF